ncbi:MAG: hypothetical protein PHI53_01605 [Candidatus Pacebacteria bacterium]|nr:hypothetical protein [Candidatus Paceibacterota bacterium]
MWINEGIALFLANQNKKKDFTKNDLDFFFNNFFDKNIKLRLFAKNNGYKVSYWAVKTIVKMFNRKKLLKIIRIDYRKNCKQKIEKVLKISREKFQEILNKNTSLS